MAAGEKNVREEIDRALVLVKRSLAYWKRAIAVIIVGMAIAVPVVFTRPRIYRSETVILYQETLRTSDLGGSETGEGASAKRVGPRLREVLFSRQSLEPIIKDLKLSPKANDPQKIVEAVDEIRKAISFRAREGDTFEIAFYAYTPEMAQAVTQRLGDCIVQEAASHRADRAQVLKEFLNAESQANASDLRQKEAAMAAFESEHPALAMKLRAPNTVVPGSSGGIGASAPPTSSDPILAGLEFRAAKIDRQLQKAQGQTPAPVPTGPRLPVFQPPPDSAELLAARRDLADKMSRYTDRHPDVIAARTRLKAAEDAQQQLYNQALEAHAAAVASAKTEAARDEPAPKNAADEAALRQQLGDLQGQIAARRAQLRGDAGTTAAQPEVAPNVALEVEFRRLDRDLAEARARQQALDDRLFKASLTASSVMSDRNVQVSVLDPAYLPTRPISSSRTNSVLAAFAALLLLAIALALVSAKLDDRIHDKFDLERLDILPIVGVIPNAQLPPDKRSSG